MPYVKQLNLQQETVRRFVFGTRPLDGHLVFLKLLPDSIYAETRFLKLHRLT